MSEKIRLTAKIIAILLMLTTISVTAGGAPEQYVYGGF